MKTRTSAIQRCACGKKHEPVPAPERGFDPEPVQRTAAAARGLGAEGVHPGVLRPSSGGAPLPGSVRERMERALGHDFADVRVHHGGEAESIGAVAFTRGTHLHFAPGRYQPHSAQGQHLLGHELAHVVQQRAGRVARPGGPVPINAAPALEREADAAGARVAGGRIAGAETPAAGSGGSAGDVIQQMPGGRVRNRRRDRGLSPAPRLPVRAGSDSDDDGGSVSRSRSRSRHRDETGPEDGRPLHWGHMLQGSAPPPEAAAASPVAMDTADAAGEAAAASPAAMDTAEPAGEAAAPSLAMDTAGPAGEAAVPSLAMDTAGPAGEAAAASPAAMHVSASSPPAAVHAPSALASPSPAASADEFTSRLGYRLRPGTYTVEPDDPTLETDAQASDLRRAGEIGNALKVSQDRYLAERDDSSDSDAEVEKLVLGGKDRDRVSTRRRRYKASQLAAIARTFHPLTDEEKAFHHDLGELRARDNAARPGHYQMYARDTREHFAEVGEQFKQTSLYHNPYLRRAFHAAIKPKDVQGGGSARYDAVQGKVREELQKVLARDHEKMKWKEGDFPADGKTWPAVEFMLKHPISNAATAPDDTFHARHEAGASVEGSSPRMAFHHGAWKEAMHAAFADYALTPTNLTGLNDMRELSLKKREKREAAGLAPLPAGAHDLFGHQSTGFVSSQKGIFKRSRGGGQFKDIDLEAVQHVMGPLLQPRARKRKLYDPG